MALDRQKILSELGNVVNQLQSANCGCLGNVFEKQAAPNTQFGHGHVQPSWGGHHHGCSEHGSHRALYANNYQGHGNCMSQFNPQKLFAEGMNYINNDIVQSVVKEVNDELKSITPENTVANSPLAFQMGLPCSPSMPQGAQQGIGQNNMENSKGIPIPNFVNMVNNNTKPTTPIMQDHQNFINKGFNQMNNIRASYNQPNYGQHAQESAKFKQMFPGIMGQGDLGFDPMNIAIHMKALNKKDHKENEKVIKNVTPGVQPSQNANMSYALNQNLSPDPTYNPNLTPRMNSHPNSIPINAPQTPNKSQIPVFTQNNPNTPIYQNDQQAYYALSDQPMIEEQVTNDKLAVMQQQPPLELSTTTNIEHQPASSPAADAFNQHLKDPSNSYNYQSHVQPPEAFNQHLKDPSNSYNYQYHVQPQTQSYSILGQPIDMVPANVYHSPQPNLPQTLSPQPLTSRYSNVKSTVSKTSLTGTKPIGKTISKSHLQRMYNEYKGSQSFIPPKPIPQGVTQSDGKINVTNNNNAGQFLERVGGDTELNKEMMKKLEAVGQNGDVPATNNINNILEKPSPDANPKHRNGLQDIVFPSYPSSTAWSFHG